MNLVGNEPGLKRTLSCWNNYLEYVIDEVVRNGPFEQQSSEENSECELPKEKEYPECKKKIKLDHGSA
jgi:hypothetical protein